MLERSSGVPAESAPDALPDPLPDSWHPWRPVAFFSAAGLTIAGLVWLSAFALSPGGLGIADLILIVLFAVTMPWYVLGFWNAVVGFALMRFTRDAAAAVMPAAGRITGTEPIRMSTAILLCVRNEPPARTAALLEPLLAGLAGRGVGAHFHIYVLSDTSDSTIAGEEETCFAALSQGWQGRVALTYRRRGANVGFKAGNIADFCARWGK
ncbi:MAG: glucans biosynthesis glucosyltransferase MdoH, partial [Proteobacteria bacterium]